MCLWQWRRQIFRLLLLLITWVRHVTPLCPGKCKCNEEKLVVLCKGANLDIVPITLNPALKELHLKKNHIKSIMTSFNVYRNLEFLDMSDNQLSSLGENNFQMQKQLRVLMLSRNMISSVNNKTFSGLASLQILHLNDNYLQELPPGVFAELAKLEVLELSRNQIATVSSEAFLGLINLKTLLLRDNKLGHIPMASFHYLTNLIKLDMGMNSFAEVAEYSFTPISKVEELSLDVCGIRTIHPGAFKHLDSLLSLQLQDNDMQEIPTEALSDLTRLEVLYIGQEKLKQLKAHAFRGLNKLRVLIFNGANELQVVERDVFAENHRLEMIVLEHNRKLYQIEPGILDHLEELRYVSLRGNSIVTLDHGLLSSTHLDYVDLRDNPFKCNCSLLWLRNYLRKKNFTDTMEISNVLCSEPPDLKNKPLTLVTSNDLGCHSNASWEIITGGIVTAVVGAAALVVFSLWCRSRVCVMQKKCDTPIPESRCSCDKIPVTTIMIGPPMKKAPITHL